MHSPSDIVCILVCSVTWSYNEAYHCSFSSDNMISVWLIYWICSSDVHLVCSVTWSPYEANLLFLLHRQTWSLSDWLTEFVHHVWIQCAASQLSQPLLLISTDNILYVWLIDISVGCAAPLYQDRELSSALPKTAVLRIHDILVPVWIRIRVFLLITFWRHIYIIFKDRKSERSH